MHFNCVQWLKLLCTLDTIYVLGDNECPLYIMCMMDMCIIYMYNVGLLDTTCVSYRT